MVDKTRTRSHLIAGNPAYVLLGEFGRAHGLKGEIRLKSFTQDPQAIADYSPLLLENGAGVIIKTVRQAAGDQPDLLVVTLEGVTGRDAVEALNRKGLYIERSRLPEPETEDEFLHTDLIGLKVISVEGGEIGRVAAISNYGGGDILEIEPGNLLVPFTKAFVPSIDVQQGCLTINYAESVDEEDPTPEL